ncbi:MAG TPA: hypothetical protein VG013_11820 [Gemmataceae bacterium]|nr:hypothetical protein [Gemmataceae bacterium]
MTRRLLYLFGASSAFWLLVALPARHLGGGDAAAVYSGTALLLCLLPAVVTLVWAGWALEKAPEQQLALVLGGTGLRLFVVLAAAWVLVQSVPYYREHGGFWNWLVVCYLFTLAMEMTLLLAGRPAAKA